MTVDAEVPNSILTFVASLDSPICKLYDKKGEVQFRGETWKVKEGLKARLLWKKLAKHKEKKKRGKAKGVKL